MGNVPEAVNSLRDISGVTMARVNYNLEIENADDRLANTWPSFARTIAVGTLSSTLRRLREDLMTVRGDTERTATLVLTKHGTFRFSRFQETS